VNESKPLILIVEDDEDIQNIYREMIEDNFDVIIQQSYNGQEGLDAVKKTKPDFIILDILMPIMNGDEFLNKLRTELLLTDIPVVVCSVNQTLAGQLLSQKKANAILPKLFQEEQLIQTIQEHSSIKLKA
jgi:CheY-like chemotaxis protein